jgi:hypothetical protein
MRIRKDGKRHEGNIGKSSGSHPTMSTFESDWKESPDREEDP